MEDIENIYKTYAKLVYNYIFALTRNRELAEEVVQETFLIAIKQIKHFRGDCKISVWLCQIAKNILYKELKKDKCKISVSLENLESIKANNIDNQILFSNIKISLSKVINSLDVQTREVMYLRLIYELSFKEIGELLGKTENWARVTFFRGKQKINKEDLLNE